MAYAHDITLRDLQDDASAVLRRAEHGEHLRILVDDRASGRLLSRSSRIAELEMGVLAAANAETRDAFNVASRI